MCYFGEKELGLIRILKFWSNLVVIDIFLDNLELFLRILELVKDVYIV